MPKTCRTCKSRVTLIRCKHHHAYMAPGETYDCYEPRETPLLVDTLARALQGVQDEDRLNELVALGRDHFNESMLILLGRVFSEIGPVLARYDKEVGDA